MLSRWLGAFCYSLAHYQLFYFMTKEEQVKKIKEIYQKTLAKLADLKVKQKNALKEYMEELRQKKIKSIKKGLGLSE